MDRYENIENGEKKTLSRVSKNDSLYNQIKTTDLSRVRTSSNIKVIENSGKTIDLEKVRKYIEENKSKPTIQRKILNVEEPKKEEPEKLEETKEYDILSVLEKAKRNREIDYEKERYKRLRDTQYDILSKIKMYEQEESKKDAYLTEELNTEERTLVNLINTITIHKGEEDLLGELMGGKTSEITLPIEKEKENATFEKTIEKELQTEELRTNLALAERNLEETKEQDDLEKTKELVELKDKRNELDKSFFTNSMTFSKEDFEGFEELEKSVKKNSVLTRIMLAFVVIIIIISLVIITNYVFKLGLF